MRCARCDRLVIPQATGVSRHGDVVFGWCVQCLEETGCVDIAPAKPKRRHKLHAPSGRPNAPFPSARTPRHPLDERRRVVNVISVILGSWGVMLILRAVLAFRQPRTLASPFGNGSFALLFAGGVMCCLVGLGLWAAVPRVPTEASVPRKRPGFRHVIATIFRRGSD